MNRTKRTEAEQQALLAYLREHYEYEPKNGRLRNKRRGTVQKLNDNKTSSYYKIKIKFKGKVFKFYIHHAVWAVCKGEWPKGTIDHINSDVSDNHIENLRECSMGENRLNMIHPWVPNKDTGLPGVYPEESCYRTYIAGKRYHFHSPYEAFFYATLCGKMYASNKH